MSFILYLGALVRLNWGDDGESLGFWIMNMMSTVNLDSAIDNVFAFQPLRLRAFHSCVYFVVAVCVSARPNVSAGSELQLLIAAPTCDEHQHYNLPIPLIFCLRDKKSLAACNSDREGAQSPKWQPLRPQRCKALARTSIYFTR